MPSRISNEKIERIKRAHELDLTDYEGTVFAGVNKVTFQRWKKGLGLHKRTGQNDPKWGTETIVENLRRVRAEEGVSGLWTIKLRVNHTGLYTATLRHFEGYSCSFEAAFGLPYSKGAMYFAERIEELHGDGLEIDPAALSNEQRVFRQLIKQGLFKRICQFATEKPEVQEISDGELDAVLARMILRHPSRQDSFPESAEVFPPQYRLISKALLSRGVQRGLLVSLQLNGAAAYQPTENAVPLSIEILNSIYWLGYVPKTQDSAEALAYIERALDGLEGEDRAFVHSCLKQALCNPKTYDTEANTYKPKSSDFRRAAIVSHGYCILIGV